MFSLLRKRCNPPQHPFEINITLNANNWSYVLRTMEVLKGHLENHGPHSLCWGEAGGAYNVTVETRAISETEYERELEAWLLNPNTSGTVL